MPHQKRAYGPNPYEKPTKIVAGVLSGIFTFFVFPFAFLSVEAVSAFSADKYPWLPLVLVEVIWGALLMMVLFALTTLVLVLGINSGIKFIGRLLG